MYILTPYTSAPTQEGWISSGWQVFAAPVAATQTPAALATPPPGGISTHSTSKVWSHTPTPPPPPRLLNITDWRVCRRETFDITLLLVDIAGCLSDEAGQSASSTHPTPLVVRGKEMDLVETVRVRQQLCALHR